MKPRPERPPAVEAVEVPHGREKSLLRDVLGERRVVDDEVGCPVGGGLAVLDLSDPRRPKLVRTFEPPFRAHDVVFAPDGAHVWVTSGASNALALYRLAGGAPRVLATGAPPQHVAFARSRAFVACGRDGTVQRRGLDGSPVLTTRVPHGSYNVTFGSEPEMFGRPAVVTPSLNEGTVTVLEPGGAVRFVRRVTRSAHDACVVQAG